MHSGKGGFMVDCLYGHFKNITDKMEKDNKIFIFFEKGTHKIKKKAEQIACEKALNLILNKT